MSIYSLVAGRDRKAGTATADTFIASLANDDAGSTLNAGDEINAAGGNDLLSIMATNTLVRSINNLMLSGVEKVSVDASGKGGIAGNTNLGMASAPDLNEIGVSNSRAGATVAFRELSKVLTKLHLSGDQGNLLATSKAGVVNGNSVSIELNAVGSQSNSPFAVLPDYPALNLNSTGAATNYLSLAGTYEGAFYQYRNGATVTVSGNASMALDTRESTHTLAVNAAAMTGNAALTLDLSGASKLFSAIGTANNDLFILSDGITQATGAIDGGAGDDRAFSSARDPSLQNGPGSTLNNWHSVETVRILGAASQGASYLMPSDTKTFEFAQACAADFSVTTSRPDAQVTLLGSMSGQLGLRAATGDVMDRLTLALGDTTSTGQSHGTIVLDGADSAATQAAHIENLILVSHGAAGAVNSIEEVQMGEASAERDNTVTILGDRDLVLHAVTAGVIDASSFDARLLMKETPQDSSADAGMAIQGGNRDDILIGSAGKDEISAGAGNDVLKLQYALHQQDVLAGGSGNDSFVFHGMFLDTVLESSCGTAGIVTLSDFDARYDQIVLHSESAGGARSATLTAAKIIASANTLAEVYGQIAAATPGTSIAASDSAVVSAAIVNVQAGACAGTYLFANDYYAGVNASHDMLVKLTGQNDTDGIGGTFTLNNLVFQ